MTAVSIAVKLWQLFEKAKMSKYLSSLKGIIEVPAHPNSVNITKYKLTRGQFLWGVLYFLG